MMKRVILALPLVLSGALAAADTVVDKQPDIGPYWNPLSNGRETYVYASDFICPDGETQVAQLGIWLEPLAGEPYSEIGLQIWGGDEFSGPDSTDVIATTADVVATSAGLNLYVADVINQTRDLVPGQRYWFAATGVDRGGPENASYRVGGHTQNSSYQDNGTFWYSNDASGNFFGGQRATPQMAFQVHLVGGIGLSVSGNCPGSMTVCVTGNNEGDRAAVVYGLSEGTGPAVPGCPGLTVDVLNPTIVGVGNADANGEFCVTGNVPAAGCGRVFVQGVNLTQCATTSVEGL